MPNKQLHSRLESLFSALEQVEVPHPVEMEDIQPGWTWEADANGVYTNISNEVKECLGFYPGQMEGKHLYTYGLHPESAAAVQKAVDKGIFPVEIDSYFKSSAGSWIAVHISVYTQRDENDKICGLRGFNQLMRNGPGLPPEVRPTLSVTGLLRTPPSTEKRNLQTKPLVTTSGVSIEKGKLLPVQNSWTNINPNRFSDQPLIAQPGNPNRPAIMAAPIRLRDEINGILEILDDTSNRKWTQDELLLVQEVSRQLGLALENAQLYAAVQQELNERIRAEQEILRRNTDLAVLNQLGQELSRISSQEEIFNLVFGKVSQLIDYKNLDVALYKSNSNTLNYNYVVMEGMPARKPEQPFGNGIAEYIILSKKPLLINEGVGRRLTELGIDIPERIPTSVLGVPMLTGERPLGAIVFTEFEREKAFSSVQAEILSTVASQVSTALENTNLFYEIRAALGAIENRERYQANIARAVATLSQSGMRGLPFVLEALGQAAKASRVYFAQMTDDDRGPYWHCVAFWNDPEHGQLFNSVKIQRMPIALFPNWARELRESGVINSTAMEMVNPEKDFLLDQSIQSTLLLAVSGRTSIPSFIGFDEISHLRIWENDEVNILKVAAEAVANTIVREDLLDQLQASLDETENLYNASHRLALAISPQDMVTSIVTSLHSPGLNRAMILTVNSDPSGKVTGFSVNSTWSSGTGAPPPPVGTEYPYSVYARIFLSQNPAFYDDIYDAHFENILRDALAQNNIRSFAVLPLVAGKRQLGLLLLEYEQRHHFTGKEIRSFPPLVDQMATSVENLSLFEQTQAALQETEELYHISNGISQAVSEQELTTLVAQNILPQNADRIWLVNVFALTGAEPFEIEIVGFHDRKDGYQKAGIQLPVSAWPLVKSLSTEPITIPDVLKSQIDPVSKKTFSQFNVGSITLIPLRSSNRLIGILAASASKPSEFDAQEIHLLQVAGNSIAVALERQRLLREAQRRALELQMAAEIARDTSSTLTLDDLLKSFIQRLTDRFDFYYASIYLMDESGMYAQVREATGDAGRDLLEKRHRLSVGSRSIIGTVTSTGNPVVVNDVTQSTLFYPNPRLPETRSEMGIPLKLGDRIIGALDIQGKRLNAFTSDDLTVLQILADQIAVAIENAQAYELSQKAYEEMKEVDRVKSQFLANMSHELRTPLNSIIGFSRVILKGIDGPINDTQKQDLGAIYNSGQHLLDLINNILDLSKIEAGKMQFQFTEVNLVDTINTTLSTATGLVKDKPIKLNMIVPDDLPTVRADATRVRQVMTNLMSNATKFTEEGSIIIEAVVEKGPTGKPEVMIKVTDTGMGIAPEDQNKLFLPFSQVDDSPTRKTGGTGLGLSICKSFIDMHNGRIGLLWSEVGKGSTFFFTLPIFNQEIEEPNEPEPTSDLAVLCVDDDPQIISLYERFLKPQGYQVFSEINSKKALERAKEIKPMAITLDVMMPEKDGWSVLQDLKNDPATRDIPIIMLSILEAEEKGFSLGASDYLVKPFLQEDLVKAIGRLNKQGTIHDILIIDDDPKDLRLVQKLIEDRGSFRCTVAEGGKQGLAAIRENKPDAILLDLFMPDMDGFTLLETIRSDKMLDNIPVIILTGADLTAEQHRQVSHYGQQMLAKGMLKETELLNTLDNALKKIRR